MLGCWETAKIGMVRWGLVQKVAWLSAAAVILAGCGDDSPPDDRFEGPVPACEVELGERADGSDFEPVRASSAPEYWKPGPYAVWNTSPSRACAMDPRIDRVGDQEDVAIYITYPAASEPTITGEGDVAPGRWPLVVFAHANNDTKCGIYRRYYSLHDHWASWGFVVAAVDGIHTNCKPGNRQNIEDRIAGQLAAVDKLAELDADESSRFYGRIDTDRVVFAGHSRGGGASLIAAQRHGQALGVIDLQGIDLTAFGFGSETIEGFPVLGLTAGEDVDLHYPIVEPTEDQLGAAYAWININGGIHAHTADTVPIEPDDEPLISRAQQHDITEFFTTAFLARYLGVEGISDGPDPAADPILFSRRGAAEVAAEISEQGVFHRWRSEADAEWIDRFDGADPDTNLTGGANSCVSLDRCEEVPTYRPDSSNPGATYAKAMSRLLEAHDSGTFRAEFDTALEVAAGSSLQGRIKGPDEASVADFVVVAELDDGTTHRFGGADFVGPIPLSNRFTQLVVPTDDFADRSLAAVEFEVSNGAIFVDDLRLVK